MTVNPDALARQWFREVWDEGNESAIDRLMHPDAVVHGLADGTIRGPEGFKPLFRTFQAALGDLEIEVVRTVVEGDLCAAHCHVIARHVGDALGGPASNRPVDFWGMTFVRAKDGQVVEAWNCFDFLAMYQQLGWVKQPVVP